jgi:hypothetical protein
MIPGTSHIKGQDARSEVVPLEFDLDGEHYSGHAIPVKNSCTKEVCFELDVTLNAEHLGNIYCSKDMNWTLKGANQRLVDKMGQIIALWYE